MPQVYLETDGGGGLVDGGGGLIGGEGNVSCETLTQTDPDPNLPPECISISIQNYLADVSAALTYDSYDSTRESTNPKSQSHNPKPAAAPNLVRSSSQRYASTNIMANGPIIGLPNKIKHVTFITSRQRPPQTSSRIFPKKKPPKAAAGGKSAVPEHEPSSPKVSCIGKISDREREKCRLAHRQQSARFPRCWFGLQGLFSCGGGGGKGRGIEAIAKKDGVGARGNILEMERNIPSDEEEDDVEVESNGAVLAGLGGMRRFASARRAASWGGEGDGHVAWI